MDNENFVIRPERPEDYRETENVVREAFWNVYNPGCMEHYVLHIYRNREDFVPELDFVMEKDGKIIGHIMYVRATLRTDDGRELPVLTMGPIGILPEYKRQGYGKTLLDYSLEKAALTGAGAVMIEGDIDFYGRSGFVVAHTKGIRYNSEPLDAAVPYFLCRELKTGFLDGVSGAYHTPKGYFVDEKDVEEFDRLFQFKKK